MSGASFFDGRLRIEAGGFVYAGKRFEYGDVAGLEFKQKTYSQRDKDKATLLYETTLRLHLKNRRKLTIRPDGSPLKRVRTEDKNLHASMANAADWLGAYTFDARMDGYDAAFKTRGHVTWGSHQINARGDLFYRHAYCLNLNDPSVRCMLYPFHMACVKRPPLWWQRWLSVLLDKTETVDLRRDRDCFLYFLRSKLGIAWSSETLRVYRGIPAEGLPETPKADEPKTGQPHEERHRQAHGARGREEAREAPPPPPKPKAMPTHVQHLALLGLGADEPWDKVKARYRQLVRVHHPDLLRGKGAKEAAIKQAEDTLKGINEAYGWLEDFYKLK